MKTYFLDTNIILDNYENFFTLAENGKNTLIFSKTVINELDSKKTSEGSIGYNAREFFRIMEKSEKIEKSDLNNNAKRIILRYVYDVNNSNIIVHIINLNHHTVNESNTDIKSLNDRKIIETAKNISEVYNNMIILSNDIAFRTDAILEDLDCEGFKTDNKKVSELNLFRTFNVKDDIKLPISKVELQKIADESDDNNIENTCGIELVYSSGYKVYAYKEGTLYYEINEKDLNKQTIKPINARQKILSSLILSNTSDIIVVTSKAGGGKNVIVTSACLELMDMKQSPFEGITYIRSNIDSIENKDQEFGFLPGSLDDKMGPYLRPLKDTIDTLVRIKYKVAINRDKEAFDNKVEEFSKKYNINYEAMNFLRGGTIKNKLVIIDEAQNISISGMKLILTRIGENCKVFILGDVNQIDSKYLNERNNGLTHMMNLVGTDTDLKITGMDFNKTIRSKIAGWAADNL